MEACGISWDAADIARFLSMCETVEGPDSYGVIRTHLIWAGAKSRGRGNSAWYGSFKTQGKSVRAHKFYGVAVLGLRPRPGIHHLDHFCPDSLCVSCLNLETEWVNLKLRWIRVQVGLDEDRVRDNLVECLAQQEEEWFDDYDWRDFEHWITPANSWRFAPLHPLNFGRYRDERAGLVPVEQHRFPEI